MPQIAISKQEFEKLPDHYKQLGFRWCKKDQRYEKNFRSEGAKLDCEIRINTLREARES